MKTEKPLTLDKDLLERTRKAISDRTGLIFSKSREDELRQSLKDCYQNSVGHASFEDYLSTLESDFTGRGEIKRLVHRLTVGETYFFRNKPHYDLLRSKIMPEIVRKRSSSTRTLRIWSAGCSTGEEAYSLAILVRETIPDLPLWNIFILGTDINDQSLETAGRAEYREWSFRDINPILKERYFTPTSRGFKIHPEIREMVTFRYLNLIEGTYPLSTTGTNFMDIIMCRNVMMYFKPELTMSITRRFFRALNNGGYLIVGHTESDSHVAPEFKKLLMPNTIIYRKEEGWSDWDRGLKLRFRGSGHLPTDVVPYLQREKGSGLDATVEPPRPKMGKVKRETSLFEEGIKAYKGGNTTTAAGRFMEVLELNPRNMRACYMLALIEADRNRLEKAQELCRRCIKLYPLALEAHYLMAVIARESGDRFKEIEYLKKVIYINPDFILGHYHLGIYYLKEGNVIPARRSLENSLRLLDGWEDNSFIEGTEGMSVARLRGSINRYLEELEGESP